MVKKKSQKNIQNAAKFDLAANGTRKYQLLSYDYGHRLNLKIKLHLLQSTQLMHNDEWWEVESSATWSKTIQNNCGCFISVECKQKLRKKYENFENSLQQL